MTDDEFTSLLENVYSLLQYFNFFILKQFLIFLITAEQIY